MLMERGECCVVLCCDAVCKGGIGIGIGNRDLRSR